ncbi:hypothetical protein [Micromonospora sp. NPDC085948]|uniref:hypothetical protein n=1 Tax=Micromonospora sp. NPDC085948 TaxID=3155293 RepID=UPI003438C31B
MVAVVVVLHALQCVSGLDAPRSEAASSPAVISPALPYTDAGETAAAIVAGPDISASVLAHAHHAPTDGADFVVTACLVMLVAVGAVLWAALRRWVLRVSAGRELALRVSGPLVGGSRLMQLCVLRT